MRKRCWKTVLSAILASAMLITSAPANLSMTVQAREPGVEDTLSVLTEPTDENELEDDQTGQDSGDGQDVQKPVGTNTVNTTEDEGGDDAGSDQTSDTQTGNTEDNKTSDADDNNEAGGGAQKPAAVDATTGAEVNGKDVTFTCVLEDGFFGKWENDADVPINASEITSIVAKGQSTPGNNSWKEWATLTPDESNKVWTGTATVPEAGTYKYTFSANNGAYYTLYNNKVNLEFTAVEEAGTEDSMRDITIRVNVGANLPEKLECFYAAGSTTAAEVAVEYSLTTESQAAGVTLDGSVGAQTVTVPDNVLATGSGTGEITLTAKKVDADVSCTVTVQLIENLQKDSRETATPGAGQVTFQFFAPKPVTKLVNVKGSWNWNTATAMEYDAASGYWIATIQMPPGEYRYGFDVYEKIGGTSQWYNGEYGTSGDSGVTVTEASSDVSPIVEGKEVTFIYENGAATDVYVAGTMSGWQDTVNSDAYKMTKNTESGKWELTKEMAAGKYEYKYIYLLDGDKELHWAADPLNPNKTEGNDPNSILIVEGLADSEVDLNREAGKAELASTLKLFDETGASSEVAVTYDLSEETKNAAYKDAVKVITEEGKTYVNITEAFPKSVSEFTLTASDENQNTSKVTVTIVDKTYKYTIYYYDRDESHRSVDASELWIWNEVKTGETSVDGGKVHLFDEAVELEDGRTWLKAEVSLSYTSLGIIPKIIGGNTVWDWQENNRYYINTDEADEVSLYIVSNDGAKIYTELPEIQEVKERYLVVEYTRETKKDGKWQFYTWNSGFGGSVWVPFETENDTLVAKVPVKPGVDSISFCIARTEGTDPWGEKDGNDYNCPVPADQNIVKIKMEEGKGITYTYPYNTGYEIDTKEKEINFYYRDDEAFLAGSEGGYEDVTLELIAPKADDAEAAVDGQEETSSVQTAKMTYDAEEQRYEWTLDQLVPGDHYYRYARKKTASDAAEYVLDDFNELKQTVAETEYSVLKYDLLDVEMEAEIQNATMDYNDNNVLKIKVNAKDSEGEPIENTDELKVVDRATVDLSALGGGVVEIDPELLAVTIAVKQGTSAGEKTLPITIYDVYNNEYKTEAKVTVVDRGKGSDFDWDEAVVYFAVTDRFFDGNSSNNEGGVPGSYDPDTNGGLNSSYHGGDFAGLTQKLDYLQELGVNTIWITPIVENQTVANSVDDPTVTQAWGYTGYWAKDFTKLDSHLGTEAEFSALLDAAHAKGMKVMVDVVLNHTGYVDEITDYYNTNFKNEDGEVIRMLRGNDEIVPGSDQMSSLSGLPDFRTEDPEVRELIVEWQSNWISRYPIDYYRVDTVKHVDDTTWSAFKNALTEINPDFKMIGEWAGAGYGTDTGMLNTGRMDALLDFDFPAKAADFVTGDLSSVEGFLSARNGAIDNTASLGAFLSNHDQQGFVHRLTAEKHKSEEEAKQLALVAASLQLTAKGQVYIYYGEEIGDSNGEENYPYQSNRKDFDWSKVTNDNQALAHYKKMLAIRNMYSELFAKGSRETVSTGNGLDVFKRSYGGNTLTVALNITGAEQTYTLSGQTPGMAVVDYYSGTQYPVDENGNAVITVPAAADGGTVVLGTENFRIDLQEGMQIKSIPDQTYTGLSIKLPEDVLQVYDGTTRLTEGVDYTVSYKNNKAVGTATVTIKGRGNYKMSETAQFNIVPKNVAELDIVYKDILVANGSVQKPLSKITNNGRKLAAKEYQVVYYQLGANDQRTEVKGVREAGEYEMVITGLKNYTGTVTKAISVKDTGTYMTKLKIELEYSSKEYTGSALEPTVTVKSGSEPVAADCYTVSYSNNTNVGTANVIVTGVSAKGYYGSVTKTFKITGTELSKVAQVDTTNWQAKLDIDPIKGNAEQANAVLTAKKGQSVTLTKGKDYTVSYSNNTKPGTATVTFTGAGKYTGTIKKTFKINAIKWAQSDLGKNLLITVDETAPYSKNGATAGVTVTYKNKRLTAGKDYKLTYKNNKNVTAAGLAENKKPSVEVTGIGSFSGKVKAGTFSIVAADLSDWMTGITVTVPDAVYSNSKGSFISKPVVKGADGTYLKSGADYEVKYEAKIDGTWVEKTSSDEALDRGTPMQVTVTGKGSYTGAVTKGYKIVNASIRKATIIAKAQTYTGKAITLDASDFSKAKLGKDKLTYGVDYEIVPGSYEKNVNKGTASVTVRGIGNYGDEKKVTFRITSSIMRWWWNLFS